MGVLSHHNIAYEVSKKKKKVGKDISAVMEEGKNRCYWGFSCMLNVHPW